MATPRTRGFACEFAQKLPTVIQSKCSLCLLILREPYQAPCCGNSFCKVCIERIKTDNKPCPTCKEENFSIFYYKGLELTLLKYQVYCSHKQEGCEWKGELGQLDNHLNLSPQPDKQLEGCDYSKFECIYCSELVKRSNFTAHQIEHCSKRPFKCEYCHSYESDYDDVINNHWPVCGYHPVECPNDCGTTLKRQDLENHVTKDCPETVIACDFHHVGCDVKLPRKDMLAHLNNHLITHLSLQAASYNDLQERMNKLETENETHKCQLEILSTQSQQEITRAQLELSQQVSEKAEEMEKQMAKLELVSKADSSTTLELMKRLNLQVYNSVNFTMHNYQQYKQENKIWDSPPFYTHPRGYKLNLRVYANGNRDAYMSVYIRLMQGEFDEFLPWPFQGEVVVNLLEESGKSHELTIPFTSPGPNSYNYSRVTDGLEERGENGTGYGYGKSYFISLSHSKIEQTYLKNDCLNFCVTFKALKGTEFTIQT